MAFSRGTNLGIRSPRSAAAMINPGSIANVAEWWDRRHGYFTNAGTTPANVGDDVYRHVGRFAATNADQSTSGNRPTRTIGGLQFNGAQSDFLELPSNFLQSYTAGLTIAVWVYWTGGSTNWHYIFECSGASNYFLITPRGSPGGTPRGLCCVLNTGSGEVRLYSGTPLPNNIWSHVAVTFDGTNGYLYLNKTQVGSVATSFVPSALGATSYNWFGKSHFGDPYFDGQIGERAFYTRGLTSAEIGQIYDYDNCDGTPFARYLMPSWTTGGETLSMLQSADGSTFTAYPCDAVTGIRDPSLFYNSANRKWYVCCTNHFFDGTAEFLVVETPLVHDGDKFSFTTTATVSCAGVSGANRSWAPKWYIEAALANPINVVISISTSGTGWPFQPYVLHPTNAGLTTWSTPVAVTGTAIPANVIDSFIFKYGTTYYLIGKNETTKYPYLCSSSSPFSGYDTLVRSGDWLGIGQCEGLSVVNMGTFWRIFYDDYLLDEGTKYVDTSDLNLATCTFGSEVALTSPFVPRHGTIIDTQAA